MNAFSRSEWWLITRLWYPLALTWFMMSVEGPFVVAVIGRLADPASNLAAFQVAFSVAMLVESPIMMLLSASAALGNSRPQYEQLFRFASLMNVPLSLLMVVIGVPPIFAKLNQVFWGLPVEVAQLVQGAVWLLVPWPAAIGYRRLWQGILIARGESKRVTAGTVVRLLSMGLCALGLRQFSGWPGAWVGAASLSAGVVAEMLAARFWAHPYLQSLPPKPKQPLLGMIGLWRFYSPLLLTSVIHVALTPFLTFLMAKGREALPSLAVFPAVSSTVFLFSCWGIAYQEVVIVLMGTRLRRWLWKYALGIGVGTALGLAITAWPDLSEWWLRHLYDLPPTLAPLAQKGLLLSIITPFLVSLLAYYKGTFIHGGRTRLNLFAALLEVSSVLLLTSIGLFVFGLRALEGAILGLVGSRMLTLAWASWVQKNHQQIPKTPTVPDLHT
jgi:Na+-driven multidrug efflux pump